MSGSPLICVPVIPEELVLRGEEFIPGDIPDQSCECILEIDDDADPILRDLVPVILIGVQRPEVGMLPFDLEPDPAVDDVPVSPWVWVQLRAGEGVQDSSLRQGADQLTLEVVVISGLSSPGERSILARPLDRLSPSLCVTLLVDVKDWTLDVVAVFIEVAAQDPLLLAIP